MQERVENPQVEGAAQAEGAAAPAAPQAAPAAAAAAPQAAPQRKKTSPKVLAITIVCIALIIAAIASTVYLGNGNYYLVSVAIAILTMVPFFATFESRKPQARDLVILAVVIAIAVVSRAAFFWFPDFKPIAAVIIIAGIAFGPQAGFMTGALSMLISNFLFGQGPWTPWQMLAFGVAGLVFGVLAQKGLIPRKDYTKKQVLLLTVGGFVFTWVIIGPLLDVCALFLMVDSITPASALTIFASGVPVNFTRAVATALLLFFATNPLLDKLERVKVKYGMGE